MVSCQQRGNDGYACDLPFLILILSQATDARGILQEHRTSYQRLIERKADRKTALEHEISSRIIWRRRWVDNGVKRWVRLLSPLPIPVASLSASLLPLRKTEPVELIMVLLKRYRKVVREQGDADLDAGTGCSRENQYVPRSPPLPPLDPLLYPFVALQPSSCSAFPFPCHPGRTQADGID